MARKRIETIQEINAIRSVTGYLAMKRGMGIVEEKPDIDNALRSLQNPLYLAEFFVMVGPIFRAESLLSGKQDDFSIHYFGGSDKNNPNSEGISTMEALHVCNSRKIIVATYEYSSHVGVLQVCDINATLLLQVLSGVTKDLGGGSSVVYYSGLPRPQPCVGVAQFTAQDLNMLAGTI